MLSLKSPTSRCPNPLSYWVLLLTVTAYGVVNNVVFSLLPLIGTSLGLTTRQITLIGSCAALLVFLVSPWWGRKSDQWGRRTSILIGVCGYCFSALLLVLFFTLSQLQRISVDTLYYGVFASRMLQAFLIAAMLPAITAYVIDITTPDERAIGLSQTGAAHGVGAIVGPSLVMLAAWSLLLPLYAAVGLALLIAILVAKFLVEPSKRTDNASSVTARAKKLSYFDPRYRYLLLVGVFIYMGMAVSTQMMGFYLPYIIQRDALGSATALGTAQALMAGATVFGQLVLVQRLSWSPMRLLQTGIPTMVVGFGLIATAVGLAPLCAGVVLLGLGLGITGPGFSAAVSLSVESHEQGAVAGFLAACPALGYVIGPFGAGMLYEWQPRSPFVIVALLLIAAGLVLHWQSARSKQ
ncbi:MAG: MFS transporter [Pseudomonadales bacterium]